MQVYKTEHTGLRWTAAPCPEGSVRVAPQASNTFGLQRLHTHTHTHTHTDIDVMSPGCFLAIRPSSLSVHVLAAKKLPSNCDAAHQRLTEAVRPRSHEG